MSWYRHSVSDSFENTYTKLLKSIYFIELKTLWHKGKLLVLSNFPFCHNVFKSSLLQRHQKVYICGKRLFTLSPDISLDPSELHCRIVIACLCRGSPSNSSWSISFHIKSSPFSKPTAIIFRVGCQHDEVAWQLLCNFTFRSFSPWQRNFLFR